MNARRPYLMAENRQKMRRAYTLAEVLLVVALMAVIAAMAWPSLQKPFAARRLHAAADVVRAAWFQARTEAIRSGQTYAFRYQLGGDRFCTSPEDAPPTPNDKPLSADKTLPEGIKFLAAEMPNGDLSALPLSVGTNSQDGLLDAWSDPVYFYPDGTTSDVRLVLTGDQGRTLCIVLRGITGTASVTDLDSIAEQRP